jgi:hypothetical protein
MTIGIKTVSIMTLCYCAESGYAGCPNLFIVMLNAMMLSVVMLSVVARVCERTKASAVYLFHATLLQEPQVSMPL